MAKKSVMKTLEVNLNQDVLVKLTPVGRTHLQRVGQPVPKEDKDGWSRWQFNDLWMTFGNAHSFGRDCFDSTVQFVAWRSASK